MHYLDTSVLVSALTTEKSAPGVRRWLANHEDLFISPWVQTEFASTMSRKSRAGELDEKGCTVARSGFEQLTRDSLGTVSIDSRHFTLAAQLCEADAGLRSSDALHLAVARENGMTLVSRDVRFVAASRSAGHDAINPDEDA